MTSPAPAQQILVVDDNIITTQVIKRNLERSGFHVFTAHNVKDAVDILSQQKIDLVITDYKMPRLSGLDLIRYVQDHFPDIRTIMLTGYGSIPSAVAAIKEGADEYITKPFTDKELLTAVQTCLPGKKERADAAKIYHQTWERFGLIGESRQMTAVFSKIEKACQSDASVLITGENGTGKELVARAIHYHHTQRSVSPFVPINCPGIPASLFESELFGHTRGAFTGAVQEKKGFFQAAENGSLFLDEISEIPFELQAKLLRVLQEKEVCLIGDTRAKKFNARIIAATNKSLEDMIKKNRFRQDLFFRLNIIGIDIPPLRDRGNDSVLLAHHFALKYARKLGRPQPEFTPKALMALKKYAWPGNVRELENTIHRCLIMTDHTTIDRCDFPETMRYHLPSDPSPLLSLEEMSRKYVRKVVEQTGGNKANALKILKIDRKTLLKKLTGPS